MACSGNVSFNVLQQKCCNPNKLRSGAIRVVAFLLTFFDRRDLGGVTRVRTSLAEPKQLASPAADDFGQEASR